MDDTVIDGGDATHGEDSIDGEDSASGAVPTENFGRYGLLSLLGAGGIPIHDFGDVNGRRFLNMRQRPHPRQRRDRCAHPRSRTIWLCTVTTKDRGTRAATNCPDSH